MPQSAHALSWLETSATDFGRAKATPKATRSVCTPPQPRHILLSLVLAGWVTGASAQATSPASAPVELPLFAVEIKVGPKWDPSKPPQEQAFFREHSANLRRMRESGVLVMGARYSDKGLVVVAVPSAAEVKAQMEQDPSFAAGTFVYEVHPFNVFYSGELKARPRR